MASLTMNHQIFVSWDFDIKYMSLITVKIIYLINILIMVFKNQISFEVIENPPAFWIKNSTTVDQSQEKSKLRYHWSWFSVPSSLGLWEIRRGIADVTNVVPWRFFENKSKWARARERERERWDRMGRQEYCSKSATLASFFPFTNFFRFTVDLWKLWLFQKFNSKFTLLL